MHAEQHVTCMQRDNMHVASGEQTLVTKQAFLGNLSHARPQPMPGLSPCSRPDQMVKLAHGGLCSGVCHLYCRETAPTSSGLNPLHLQWQPCCPDGWENSQQHDYICDHTTNQLWQGKLAPGTMATCGGSHTTSRGAPSNWHCPN